MNKKYKQMLSYFIILTITSFVTISLLIPQNIANAARDDDDWQYVEIDKCKKINEEDQQRNSSESSETSKEDEGVPSGGAGNNWLKKGTKEYKVAEEVFNIWTDEYGASGEAASGILGNVKQESVDFYPDVYEGGKRLGMNTKPPGSAGGGLYQFTPASKYSNSKFWKKDGKDGWDPVNQTAGVWSLEFENREVEMYMKIKGTPYKTIEELLTADDPAKAADTWERAYERPRDAHPERQEYAKQANAVFNKDNVKADKSKIESKLGGKSSGGKTPVDTSDKEKNDEENAENVDCKTTKKEKKEDLGAASWGKDGTGDAGIKAGEGFEVGWMPDKLPKNLKQYAIDPKRVELGWENSKNWKGSGLSTNGQCVNLSTSMFGLIWTKDGKTPTFDKASSIMGNGNETAANAAKVYGTKTTHTPSKGAVFSAAAGSKLGPSFAGHTGIVSHVFKNGDVLLLEQNVSPIGGSRGSGDDANRPMTWNYRLISKSAAATQTYATMDGVDGWKVNEKLKGDK